MGFLQAGGMENEEIEEARGSRGGDAAVLQVSMDG